MVDRKSFLTMMATLPFGAAAAQLKALQTMTDSLSPSERMPVLFLGHGSPMNAIEDNVFTKGFREIAKTLPMPQAILCISAHWETKGTWVTAMNQPRTIHDFGGFPKELFEVQYPAPGSPLLANETKAIIQSTTVGLDAQWGLDHGSWSVIKHLYPKADVPIVQMSIDYTQPTSYHYALAKELLPLRRKGVLIIGSGNSVHNLRMVAWDQLQSIGYGYDWAKTANDKIKQWIADRNHKALTQFEKQGQEMKLAIPTPEHYLPMLYALALQEKDEQTTLYNDILLAGSLNMLSIKIDKAS